MGFGSQEGNQATNQPKLMSGVIKAEEGEGREGGGMDGDLDLWDRLGTGFGGSSVVNRGKEGRKTARDGYVRSTFCLSVEKLVAQYAFREGANHFLGEFW